MRDLADDLRDYFDALIEAPAATAVVPPRRRWQLAAAVALAVAAAGAALVITRPDPRAAPVATQPPVTSAVAEKDGLRLGLRMVSDAASVYTVEVTIENVGTHPVRMFGALEPNVCQSFPVQLEAVRTAWDPGDQPWPGADHYLGPVRGPGWSNIESRGSPFADPLLDQAKQATVDSLGYIACGGVLEIGSFFPGERATRTFTWTPPAGWPGGQHELVARYFLGYENVWRPVTVAAGIPVDVRTDVPDAMGPAEALRRLAADPAFQSETTARGGLMGVTSTWSPGKWTLNVQWMDSKTAFWTVDQRGTVARSDLAPRP